MAGVLAADPTLADFGADPLWITIVKAVLLFLFLSLGVVFGVWFERKLIARMQNRYGPNRAGPSGILQSVADAIKMGLKEDLLPRGADRLSICWRRWSWWYRRSWPSPSCRSGRW